MTRQSLHPLPAVPGRPAMLEGPQILTDLTNQCRGDNVGPWTRPWALNVRVHGVAGPYRVDRELRVGFWPFGSSMRIESVPISGAGSFVVLVPRGPSAPTVLLEGGTRVARTDRAETMFGKLLGTPLAPSELEALLRGCNFSEPANHTGGVGRTGIPALYGTNWVSIPFGRNGRAFYRRASAGNPWRPTTLLYPGKGLEPSWRIDYHDIYEWRMETGTYMQIPQTLLVTGVEAANLKLAVTLSNVLSASLPDDLFEGAVPPNSEVISLDQVDLARLLAP
jgi:hypothetical protein